MASIEDRVEGWKRDRPSRIWEFTDGPTSWTAVDVYLGLAMADILHAIRPSLETMRIGVTVWPMMNERNVRRVLGGEDGNAPYVLLAIHGDAERLILSPPSPAFSLDEVRAMLRVPDKVVVAVGCASGTPEWADVFFAAGATDYIAPAGAPFAHAAPLFVNLVFYALTQGRDLAAAVELARSVDRELAIWTHFRP